MNAPVFIPVCELPPTAGLAQYWVEEAEKLKRWGAVEIGAALERCAAQLEAAHRRDAQALLTLGDAARESGYTEDHIGRLLRGGQIPNAGRRGAPRVKREDLPTKPGVLPRRRPASILQPTKEQIARSVVTQK